MAVVGAAAVFGRYREAQYRWEPVTICDRLLVPVFGSTISVLEVINCSGKGVRNLNRNSFPANGL